MTKQLLLNRNEMTVGPAPGCLKVLKNFKTDHASRYLEGYYTSLLIPKLAQKFNLPEEQVILSYGSEDLLRTVFNSLDPKKDSVLTHDYHYVYYDKYAASRGFTIHTFKLNDTGRSFVFDVADCLKQYKKIKPKIILLTSPNNPTGNSLSVSDLEKILSGVSRTTLVVVDGAYAGLSGKPDTTDYLELVGRYDNLVITRTFSKLYALAGLRIAFALCGKKVKKLLNYQPHYLGFSRILEEVAIAALDATCYYKKLRQLIIKDRTFFIDAVNKFKHFTAYESDATFVLIKPDAKIITLFTQTVEQAPFNLVRPISETLFRVSLDPQKYTKKFVQLLSQIDRQI